MAEWKKVIVSGSDAELSRLNVGSNQQISGSVANTFLSGSFSGSFQGLFTGLITSASYAVSASRAEVAGQTQATLTLGTGLSGTSFNGSTGVTAAVSGASGLSTNAVTKWTGTAFANSSLTDNGTTITGATSIQLTGANSSLSGSFSGSFSGAATLPALTNSTGISAFTYTGAGTANVAVSGASALSSNTLTKWTGTAFANTNITDNGSTVTVNVPAVFNSNITVTGTASFQNTANLLVADRFALFASGSSTTGDGGIVVQQGTQNIGELLGYDSATTRWGFTSSFNAANSTYTPVAYVGTVQTGTGITAAYTAPLYGGSTNGQGTIAVDTGTLDIWIYV